LSLKYILRIKKHSFLKNQPQKWQFFGGTGTPKKEREKSPIFFLKTHHFAVDKQ
jgi:hypothetical protein